MEIEFVGRRQFGDYFKRGTRWSWIVAHRRSGKTVACIQDLIKRAVDCDKPEPRFAYIAPTYTQAKDVAFSYVKRLTAPLQPVVSESELSVTLPGNGARIRLYGAENFDRLRGLYLDGAVLDEAGDMDPRAWPEVVRPALSDRRGWATFIGTPKGRNAFYAIGQRAKLDDAWTVLTLKASETGLLPQEELDDARKQLSREQYEQEYECSFDAAIKGAYYSRDITQAETEKRITSVPYDRNADVFACWDLGIGDAMAIWVGQIVGTEWHWINHYENSGFGLDHYVDWIKGLPYQVHKQYLPHDAAARELQTGKSREQFLSDRGLNCEIVPQHKVEDRIEAVRSRLNRMWFDEQHTQRGIECLRMYQSEFDEKHQTVKPRPLHNWASHSADAFGVGVMAVSDKQKSTRIKRKRDKRWIV
jgi:phage terminase large subunit